MPHHPRVEQRKLAVAAAAAALLAGAPAWAEESPYYIGGSLGATHDSNIFRRAAREADTITSEGIFGGVDQPLGRQRVFANANVNANQFKSNHQLNNTSYGLTSGLDWQTIEHLSGTVRYLTNQRLANYGDPNAPLTTEKNVERSQQLAATARYGISSAFALEGGAERRAVSFSLAGDNRDFTQRVGHLGLRWGGTGILSVGVGVRSTRGDVDLGDKTSRRDVDLSVTWQPSGASVVSGRLSSTRETHSLANVSEFSGVTGSLSWTYKPTGRTQFAASLSRDTGSETTFTIFPSVLPNTPPFITSADTNRLTTVLQAVASYELTGKIGLNGNLRYSRNTTAQTGLLSPNTTGHDTLSAIGLSASYAATRSVSLGCNVGHDSRSTGVADSTYSANTIGCSVQVTLR